MGWIKGGLSYADGTMDEGSISALAIICVYIALSIYAVVCLHQTWSAQQFGIGAGAIGTGWGIMLGQRKVN